MEFIKNNLSILTTIVALVISGFLNIYQYFENKRLKKYATEKDLKRREARLEKLRNGHRFNSQMLLRLGEKEKEKNEFICREKEYIAEIEYLKKILNK
jgi:hypothetical protein